MKSKRVFRSVRRRRRRRRCQPVRAGPHRRRRGRLPAVRTNAPLNRIGLRIVCVCKWKRLPRHAKDRHEKKLVDFCWDCRSAYLQPLGANLNRRPFCKPIPYKETVICQDRLGTDIRKTVVTQKHPPLFWVFGFRRLAHQAWIGSVQSELQREGAGQDRAGHVG